MLRTIKFALLVSLFATPVLSSSLTGTWATPPDDRQTTGHVEITPCGAKLCGTVVRAFDKAGKPITTRAVGKQVLIDVKASGNAGQGRVFVPTMGKEFPVRLNASGDKLQLKACNGLGICRKQVWSRVN